MLPVAWWFVQSGEQGFVVMEAHPKTVRIDPDAGRHQCLGAGELYRCQPFIGIPACSGYSVMWSRSCCWGWRCCWGKVSRRGEWLTYIPIWLAVMVLVYEGFKHLVRQRRA